MTKKMIHCDTLRQNIMAIVLSGIGYYDTFESVDCNMPEV